MSALSAQIALDECEVREFCQFAQAVFLQADVVVVVYAVQADDLRVRDVLKQALAQVRADETGRAGDEDGVCLSDQRFCCNILWHLSPSATPSIDHAGVALDDLHDLVETFSST